jgi:hypothetical protein
MLHPNKTTITNILHVISVVLRRKSSAGSIVLSKILTTTSQFVSNIPIFEAKFENGGKQIKNQ